MLRRVGIGASDGIAFGQAYIIDERHINIPQYHIPPESVEPEIARFRRAIEATSQQLQSIKEKLSWAGGEDHSLILQAHQLILQDEQLVEQTILYIRKEFINAEWALRRTIASIQELFDQVDNDYFRERRSDINFIADHILVTLIDKATNHQKPPSGSIVIAHDLSPADMAHFYRGGIHAIVTEGGGRNSHTSIIARSLAIPAVVGVPEICSLAMTGDSLIVDGYRGEIVICPDDEALRRYQRRQARRAQRARVFQKESELPATTQDGKRIRLLANIEISDEIPLALEHGAEGIGLYRTEFVFLSRRDLPSEQDHWADAIRVMEYSGDLPVTFRTCDLGVDKIPRSLSPATVGISGANPALGLRSIRLCLEQRDMFKAQLRGLLRAGAKGNARIMFPMISGIEEFRQAKNVLYECMQELQDEGIQLPHIPIGVMVEMPSAAVTADLLAQEADFFSIGTNDLTQYALAIDRVNEQVNYLFRPFHPAILRLIRFIIDAAAKTKIPLTVCGEMAADPLMTMVLMGLGVRELSMNPRALPAIRRIIRNSTAKAAKALADKILHLSTSNEVEAEVLRTMKALFPNQGFGLDEDTQV